MKNVSTLLLTLAIMVLSVSASQAIDTFVIVNHNASFSVNHIDGTTDDVPTLQAAIDLIKTQAGGTDCIIQFGDVTNALHMGGGSATLITFDGGANGTDWGFITLTGKATSTFESNVDIICMENDVSIDCKVEHYRQPTAWLF